jgi:hypothetical protein
VFGLVGEYGVEGAVLQIGVDGLPVPLPIGKLTILDLGFV